jgi:hypothetical protein
MPCWFVMPPAPPPFVLRPKMLFPPGDTSDALNGGSGGRGAAGPTVGRGRPSIGAPIFWGCTPGWGGTPGWGLTGRCCAAAPVTTASSTAMARRGPRPPRRRIMTLASANWWPFVKSPAHPHVAPVAGCSRCSRARAPVVERAHADDRIEQDLPARRTDAELRALVEGLRAAVVAGQKRWDSASLAAALRRARSRRDDEPLAAALPALNPG